MISRYLRTFYICMNENSLLFFSVNFYIFVFLKFHEINNKKVMITFTYILHVCIDYEKKRKKKKKEADTCNLSRRFHQVCCTHGLATLVFIFDAHARPLIGRTRIWWCQFRCLRQSSSPGSLLLSVSSLCEFKCYLALFTSIFLKEFIWLLNF